MKNFTIIFALALGAINTFAQNLSDTVCKLPYHVSADSLFNFMVYQLRKKDAWFAFDKRFTDEKLEVIKNEKLGKKDNMPMDSLYNIAQDYIISKVGRYVYCNYFDLSSLNSFGYDKYSDIYALGYGFSLPNLYREKPVKIACFGISYLERVNVVFTFKKTGNKIEIGYPGNLPDCQGKEDCGFKITREEAIKILKLNGFIKEGDKYTMELNGIVWIVNKPTVNGGKEIRINIQTGELSEIRTWFKN